LATSTSLLALSLPFALVPYYLLPDGPGLESPAGVFARLPADDGWVNLARVLMCLLALGTCSAWVQRGRDTVLVAMGAEGERRAVRYVGLGVWASVVALGCAGGVVGDIARNVGVLATLAVSWFLPGEPEPFIALASKLDPKLIP
jgi:hypothetical protein